MPPKKKANKKANDNWENEVAETVDPVAAATQAAKDEESAKNAELDEGIGGGGLLAALKKNKSKKAKKGKAVQEDFVEGEDPPLSGTDGVNGGADDVMPAKAAEEADADDVFAAEPVKKSGKGKQNRQAPKVGDDDEEDKAEVGGGVKSKKEKEKEKKEREKQRKKEQVSR